jgi:hypothetical protein
MSLLDEYLGLIKIGEFFNQDSNRRCPSCQEKEGDLYILPTRLSITGFMQSRTSLKGGYTANTEIPSLPNFVQEKISDLPLEYSKYCIQMLRQGYLYVLEQRNTGKQWRVFTSSPEGCLIENKAVNRVSNIPPKYNCNVAIDGADASYISFKDSKNIKKLYFLFSPNKITAKKLAYYQEEGLSLLDGITPDEIRNGDKSILAEEFYPHILEFLTAGQIAEQQDILYRKNPQDFKLEERNKIQKQTQIIEYIYSQRTLFYDKSIFRYYHRYLAIYKKLKKYQGAAIVVNDAIGITQSLNNRRHQAFEKSMKSWMQSTDQEGVSNEHRLIVLGQLEALKESFHEKRIRQLIKSNQQWADVAHRANSKLVLRSHRDMSNATIGAMTKEYQKAVLKNQTEEISKEEFQKKYWSRLSQEKIDNFKNLFEQKSQAAEVLAEKRSQDLKKWLQSEQLLKALDSYDDQNNLSGIMFSLQINACLLGTSSSPTLRKILDNWWQSTQITRDNLCWRAYLFNNQSLIKDITQYFSIQNSIDIVEKSDANDKLSHVDTAVDLLNKLTNHISQTGPVIEQLAMSGLPIAFLSISFSDLVRHFLQTTSPQFDQRVRNRLGNTLLARISVEARDMYGLKLNINGVNFTANPNRGAPQIVKNARNYFQNTDLINTRISILVLGFSGYDALRKLVQGKFKDRREQAELAVSGLTTIAAAFQVGTSVIESCAGNSRSTMTSIVTYNAFGRIFLWSASLSAIAGGMSSLFDFFDGNAKNFKDQSLLKMAYYFRGLATLILSISQFLAALGSLVPWLTRIVSQSTERTIWVQIAEWGLLLGRFAIRSAVATRLLAINFYATLIIVVVSTVIIIFDDNAMQKWLERCCFSNNLNRDKFDNLAEELIAFNKAMQETF